MKLTAEKDVEMKLLLVKMLCDSATSWTSFKGREIVNIVNFPPPVSGPSFDVMCYVTLLVICP